MSVFVTLRFYSLFLLFLLSLLDNEAFCTSTKLNIVWNSQTQYLDIASGANKVCAIAKQDSSLHCWDLFSDNDFSGLPQNEVVYNSQKYLNVVVADTHICALASDTNWYCMGQNANGELGNTTNVDTATPTLVQVPSGVHFTSLVLNNRQSCALSDTFDLYCWGDVRQPDLSLATLNIPTLVNSNIKWKIVSLGGNSFSQNDFMCGISTDNKVYCKGNNASGQLGNNTINNTGSFTLINILNNNFQTLSAGDSHACGLTNEGNIYCWGDNSYAQLGVPAYTFSATAQPQCTVQTQNCLIQSLNPLLLNTALKFVDVTAKSNSTCTKTTEGNEFCFGDNTLGQIDVVPTDTQNAQIITNSSQNTNVVVNHPVQLSALSFYKIVEGKGNTCGLIDDSKTQDSKIDHVLQCFGFLNKNKYTQIAVGANAGCGINNSGSRLSCWNNNLINSYNNFSNPWTSGFQVPWTSTEQYNFVAESANYGCAIRVADNKLACFSNSESAIIPGLLTSINSFDPKIMLFSASGPFINQFKKVAVNENHICAIQTDGLVFCWGKNDHGQLGNNTMEDSSSPVLVLSDTGAALVFSDIAVGNEHSCGLTQDNSIYCWGDNTFSQLGNSDFPFSSEALKVDEKNILNLKFNSLVAYNNSTCAIDSTGKISCFGEDKFGVFLKDSKGSSIIKLTLPTPIIINLTAQEISMKNGTLCALDNSHKVYCWGNNEEGKVNGDKNKNIILDPFQESDGLYSSVSVGENKICAIRQQSDSASGSTLFLFDKQMECFQSK